MNTDDLAAAALAQGSETYTVDREILLLRLGTLRTANDNKLADVSNAIASPASLMSTWLAEDAIWFLIGACWVGTLVLLSWAFPSLNMPPLFP